jgi:hypothetical protein
MHDATATGTAVDPEPATCFALDRAPSRDEAITSSRRADKLPPQVFAIMAVTTMVTFGTLTGGYSLFF